jgi:hypothetical protein
MAKADEACEAKKKSQFTFFLDMNDSPNELAAARHHSAEECLGFVHITSAAQFKREVAKVYGKNGSGKVPIMVISGHSVNGRFSGTRFSFGFDDLEHMKKQYPGLAKDLETVFLWGCFTGNIQKLDQWHVLFPNASGIIGYTGRSPLDEQQVGADFLDTIWPNRGLIHEGRSDEEVKEILDQVTPHMGSGDNKLFMVSAGMTFYTCNEENPNRYFYMVDNMTLAKSELYPADKVEESCREARKVQAARLADLERYWTGKQEPYSSHDAGYKDHEKNTLRFLLYPYFNQYEHCFEGGAKLKDGSSVGLGEMVNLIFYTNVKGNFEGQMGSRMKKVRAILKKAKVRMPALIYLKDRSRADIMEMDKILRADSTRAQVKKQGKRALKELDELAWLYHNVVAQVDSRCADITWIDFHPKTATKPGKECMKPLP